MGTTSIAAAVAAPAVGQPAAPKASDTASRPACIARSKEVAGAGDAPGVTVMGKAPLQDAFHWTRKRDAAPCPGSNHPRAEHVRQAIQECRDPGRPTPAR